MWIEERERLGNGERRDQPQWQAGPGAWRGGGVGLWVDIGRGESEEGGLRDKPG